MWPDRRLTDIFDIEHPIIQAPMAGPSTPQVVDAVRIPVIAAGGIADARGIAAVFALGAAGVQIGTAYLHCPEAKVSLLHRAALNRSTDESTALTNVFTGRPARGIVNRAMREIGPICDKAPPFPQAATAMSPLRTVAETQSLDDLRRCGRGKPQGSGTPWAQVT